MRSQSRLHRNVSGVTSSSAFGIVSEIIFHARPALDSATARREISSSRVSFCLDGSALRHFDLPMRRSMAKSARIAPRILFTRMDVSFSERASLRVRTNVSPGFPSLPSARTTLTEMPFCTSSHSAASSLSPIALRCPRRAPTRYLYPLSRISPSVSSVGTPLSINQRFPIFPYLASSFLINGICVSLSLAFPGSTS